MSEWFGLRVLAEHLAALYQKDWMGDANCLVEYPEDTRFIREPLNEQWEAICKQCPVSLECLEWADDNNVTGVYAAGEWRE